MDSLQMRIAPWQLLYLRARKEFSLVIASQGHFPIETPEIGTRTEKCTQFNFEDCTGSDANSDTSQPMQLLYFLREIRFAEEFMEPVA